MRSEIDVDAAETTNTSPRRFVSAQIGRLVTARRIPVYPATKKPSAPPRIATTMPSSAGGRNTWNRRHSSAARNETKLKAPNASSAHDPIDIGDHGLNMSAMRFDW